MKARNFQTAFARLIDANIEELVRRRQAPSSSRMDPLLAVYQRCLFAFHRGDSSALEGIFRNAAETGQDELLRAAIEAMIALLRQEFSPKLTMKLKALSTRPLPWRGELLWLLATIHGSLDETGSAREAYLSAAAELAAIGARRKALRAEMNAIVALSRIEPGRNVIPEYHFLSRRARKLREWTTVSTCFLNISREYQRMGALRVALKFCDKAVLASHYSMESLEYFLCLAHRARLLCELGRFAEAEMDLELARTGQYPEVRQACQALEEMLARPANGAKRDEIPKRHKPTMSPAEESLILFLCAKPREKFEICDHLFGADVHPFKAENRLKSLLNRVRLKLPGLIILEGGNYKVALESLIPKDLLKKAG